MEAQKWLAQAHLRERLISVEARHLVDPSTSCCTYRTESFWCLASVTARPASNVVISCNFSAPTSLGLAG